jgi:hypothetical protein
MLTYADVSQERGEQAPFLFLDTQAQDFGGEGGGGAG